MNNKTIVIGIIVIALIATFGLQPDLLSNPQGIESTATTTPVPQPEADANQSTNTLEPYEIGTNTGEILLRISDLPPEYELGGEVNQSQNSERDTRQKLAEQGILQQHQRSFTYNSTNSSRYPSIVVSAAIIYENQSVAERQFQQSIANLTAENATVQTREIVSGSTATVVKFQNQQGGKVVLIYSRKQNMGIYTATLSATEYRQNFTTNQYIKMLVDLG